MIWETWVQTCYNYERMMGMACAHTFLPVVKYLYPNDKAKQIDLMTREMEFFNVHPEFGSCILGLAISLEEEKAMGKDIPNVNYVNVKCGIVITTSGSTFALQESLFDAVLPNILPLGVTMGVYGLMQKKWTSVKIILAIVLVGVVGGLLNILA